MTRHLTTMLIMLVVLAAAVGAYAAMYLVVEKASARDAELAAQVERAVAQSEQVPEVRDVRAALEEEEERIASYFVYTNDIAFFLERLEGAGKGLGASVEVIAVSDRPTSDGRVSVTLRILGSFEAAMRTLGAIEYGPHDIRIENLSMDTREGVWTTNAVFSVGVIEGSAVAPASPQQ